MSLLGYQPGDNPTKCRGYVVVCCEDPDIAAQLPQWAEPPGDRYRIREIDVANIDAIWRLGTFGES